MTGSAGGDEAENKNQMDNVMDIRCGPPSQHPSLWGGGRLSGKAPVCAGQIAGAGGRAGCYVSDREGSRELMISSPGPVKPRPGVSADRAVPGVSHPFRRRRRQDWQCVETAVTADSRECFRDVAGSFLHGVMSAAVNHLTRMW